MPMLVPARDSVVPLGYKELHLAGLGRTMHPVEVKMFSCSMYVYVYRCAKRSSR